MRRALTAALLAAALGGCSGAASRTAQQGAQTVDGPANVVPAGDRTWTTDNVPPVP